MTNFDNLASEMVRRMAAEQLSPDIAPVTDAPVVRSQPTPRWHFVDTRGLLIALGCLVCSLVILRAYV